MPKRSNYDSNSSNNSSVNSRKLNYNRRHCDNSRLKRRSRKQLSSSSKKQCDSNRRLPSNSKKRPSCKPNSKQQQRNRRHRSFKVSSCNLKLDWVAR